MKHHKDIVIINKLLVTIHLPDISNTQINKHHKAKRTTREQAFAVAAESGVTCEVVRCPDNTLLGIGILLGFVA